MIGSTGAAKIRGQILNLIEQRKLRLICGHGEARVGHQRQQPDGFQANRFQPHRTPSESSAARLACTEATARNASRR